MFMISVNIEFYITLSQLYYYIKLHLIIPHNLRRYKGITYQVLFLFLGLALVEKKENILLIIR